MRGTIDFLFNHGYSLLIAWVFAEQLGLPIPSIPLLLSAGVLAGTGRLNLAIALISVVFAAVTADLIWYRLGRRKGSGVLGFICKISLEPDSCVRRTQSFYTKQGTRSLVMAKFVPGLNAVSSPLAGITGMRLRKFLLWDFIGSLLWASVFLGTGFVFSGQIERVAEDLAALGGRLVILLAMGLFAYILYKFAARRRFLRQLRIARVSVDELKGMLDQGKELVILDLRDSHDFEAEPQTIPGALHLEASEVGNRHDQLPGDREVVLYCT